jgi:hypothetical protein
MIIKRDILMHSPSIAAAMMQAAAAAASRANSPAATSQRASPVQLTTSPLSTASPYSSSSPQGHYTFSPPGGSVASGLSKPLTPLQQRDVMQREQREKERKQLLQKASNSQGQVVEKLLATYLAV